MDLRGIVRIILVISLFLAVTPTRVSASKGEPGSPEFGYGGRIEVNNTANIDSLLSTASSYHFDWLNINFAWDSYYPQPAAQPNWTQLDKVMEFAHQQNMVVMLSLTHAPAWAMDPSGSGPNPAKTAKIIGLLAQRYPQALRAIELFPGANTRAGWGAQPDPAAYAALYTAVDGQNSAIFLVAGGLRVSASSEIKDTDFLRGLYAADKKQKLRVISLQYDDLSTDPLQAQSSQGQPVLRHYEEVRSIMNQTGHNKGLIWITRLTFSSTVSSENQSTWLTQAYQQVRSQLYIGTAFFKITEAPVKLAAHSDQVAQNIETPVADTLLAFFASFK